MPWGPVRDAHAASGYRLLQRLCKSGEPALDWTRALPRAPDIDRGGPKRGALGEDSAWIVTFIPKVRDLLSKLTLWEVKMHGKQA